MCSLKSVQRLANRMVHRHRGKLYARKLKELHLYSVEEHRFMRDRIEMLSIMCCLKCVEADDGRT